jgi:hypothetical protein
MSSIPPRTPDRKAEAELRKLRLEAASLKLEVRRKKAVAESEREKLRLEIQSLKRQNGLLSRLTQFATVFTVLATLLTVVATCFSVWTAWDKFVSDKNKETELRQRELAERTERQFRATLQQLVQYPIDDRQTISSAVFNFRDIRNVVENGYEGDELQRRRDEVGFLLTQLTRSPEFDLGRTRNAEYDRKAMLYCDYYMARLVSEPGENLDVISKYKDALLSARRADPRYYSSVTVSPGDIFTEAVPPKNAQEKAQLISLFHGYEKHVELLVRSLREAEAGQKGTDAVDVRRKINTAFCWFYGATQNPVLTKSIFGVEAAQVQTLWAQECR